MWLDRIVPLRQDAMALQVDPGFLFGRDLHTRGINMAIQPSATTQSRIRFSSANEFQDNFVVTQGLSGPVPADITEQAVIRQVPLGSVGCQVPDGNGQLLLIPQLLHLL